jgi:hypothetical protein
VSVRAIDRARDLVVDLAAKTGGAAEKLTRFSAALAIE